MDHDGRQILRKICLDVFLILLVGIPIVIFFYLGKPYERGFFCDDESLKHPYHDSTVPSWTLYMYGLAFPVLTMIMIEFANRSSSSKPIQLSKNISVPYWIWRSYCAIVVFGFGLVCSRLCTDIMKYTVGRLRPHFFSVCRPSVNCTDPSYTHVYVEEFRCENDTDGRKLKDMRLSFPSGHSSFSMYAMFYLAIYLQARWPRPWRPTLLFRNVVQYACILVSLHTALSRISDYKHHWSDVLAGLLLGASCAALVGRYVSDLFVRRRMSGLPSDDTELWQTRNGTGTGTAQP